MRNLDKFHVITVISNPIRYKSRYALYKVFEKSILTKQAVLWTLELQTGARLHHITSETEEKHIQLSSTGLNGLLWLKENLLNVAIRQITTSYPDWRYVCIIDGDIKVEPYFIEETAHALQLHPVVQPWSHVVDFGPDGAAVNDRMQMSYAYCYVNNIKVVGTTSYLFGGHPGHIMAIRREMYNHLGGFLDIGVLGSGDRHMLTACVSKIEDSFHPDVSEGYKDYLFRWQERANIYLKRNLGYVPMVVRHLFHGAKKHRFYGQRWRILVDYQFNPYTDLKVDASGVYQLIVENDRQIALRDALYKYFRSRQEDSNSL